MVLTEDDGGLCLMVRVGDTFPNQTLEPVVRAYLYRWPGSVHNPGPDYAVRQPKAHVSNNETAARLMSCHGWTCCWVSAEQWPVAQRASDPMLRILHWPLSCSACRTVKPGVHEPCIQMPCTYRSQGYVSNCHQVAGDLLRLPCGCLMSRITMGTALCSGHGVGGGLRHRR